MKTLNRINRKKGEPITPEEKLFAMLKTTTLAELIRSGKIFGTYTAREKFGYQAQFSIRRLCIEGKIPHIRHGNHYYFLPEQIEEGQRILFRVFGPKA